jgi:hypothetical protein
METCQEPSREYQNPPGRGRRECGRLQFTHCQCLAVLHLLGPLIIDGATARK